MNKTKIDIFDKYVMRGGTQSLKNIEELCDYGFDLMKLGYEPDIFDDVVIDVIRKLTKDLNNENQSK